jgi:two-component system, OmpR family, phosphate regulon sensor histidine kinase PhoR
MNTSKTTDDGNQLVWRQRLSVAALAFALATFGFELSNLVANPSPLQFLLCALALIACWFLWRNAWPEKSLPLDFPAAPIDASATLAVSMQAFDVLPLPVLIVDANAVILAANKSALADFGRVENGVLLFLKFRAPEMRSAFQSVLEKDRAVHFEMHERVPLERWMRVDICPIEEPDGKTTRYLIMFRDISESRKLDRMRADFVANASHELRTPLASMSGFIDTLRGPAKDDTKARERFLAIMQDQANRMSRLIDDLLSLSRLEMRSMSDDAQTFDLAAVASEVIDSMQPVAAESGVEIERRFGKGSFQIRGMRDELVQVIENLVENACKYGKSGKKVIIEISRNKIDEGTEIMLSVRDFGPGIEPEHLPRLTERFYRANSQSASVQKGTGLGLAIVKHIMTRHRGRLSISSKPGKGSNFAIYLPGNHGDTKSEFE